MAIAFLGSLLSKKTNERFLSIDIGTSSIKMMEIDLNGSTPKLVSAAIASTPAGGGASNMVAKTEAVASAIRSLVESNEIKATKVVFGIPGPATFTKRITTSASKLSDLQSNIAFEASNYIPHKIDAVHLDFQVVRSTGSSMEVLLVAVKNEIIGSYLETLEQAGLEPAIADIDYFALENMFELNYPEEKFKTIALVDTGARFSGVNIVQEGRSVIVGDVGVGGRLYTDALCETLGMQPREADEAKMGNPPANADKSLVSETIDRTTEHVASELHRQLGFFWNAAATDKSIDTVYVSGGGCQVAGLLEELSAKTGLPCKPIDPFKQIDTSDGFDREFIAEIAPQMAVSVGLAVRRFGDKIHATN